ncbi:hypothetical protein [Spirulina sp. 06S082]|uniref:hypothetical protein n=1 Tax=Spirulina sp. 06S082 TaxID=3110248 RepID=UPI002B20B30D|nr:hypothetical protein [Spirulina sp. 06S082]
MAAKENKLSESWRSPKYPNLKNIPSNGRKSFIGLQVFYDLENKVWDIIISLGEKRQSL